MTNRLRNMIAVLGAFLLVAGVIVYGLHGAGVWEKPPATNYENQYQYNRDSQSSSDQHSVSQRQIAAIALPLGGIGIVLLMIYGFTTPAKPLPRHQQSTLDFKDPFAG